ncbi:CLUMA_CG005301, isoform A [Clunio marinus]|uniref:CLUMA_CG005301, isoform A n=1 Tax=Clunio marinus TaxID=568069 RepID=A0A1J1HUH4_9DIPT|nr:CLUMA_CG005301, isoform A [Clunio marinus]
MKMLQQSIIVLLEVVKETPTIKIQADKFLIYTRNITSITSCCEFKTMLVRLFKVTTVNEVSKYFQLKFTTLSKLNNTQSIYASLNELMRNSVVEVCLDGLNWKLVKILT